MDRHASETYQETSYEQSLDETKQLIKHIRSLSVASSSPLVQPIITPRFAIACTPNLLEGLGKIAHDDPSLAIQTHISENASEIAFTQSLFPQCQNYASVYDYYGLLTERTILGHGCHLDQNELDLIKARGAGVSHCPTSNFNLRSGLAKVAKMLDQGIKVSLCTPPQFY